MPKSNYALFFLVMFWTLTILAGFFRDNIFAQVSLLYAYSQQDMSYYQWSSLEVERYNEAVFESNKWHYDAAWSLISPLLSDKNFPKRAELAELAGDILYKQGKSRETIFTYYDLSLSLQSPNLRIEKKKQLIAWIDEITQSGSGDAVIEPPPTPTGTWTQELQFKEQELKQISWRKNDFLDIHATDEPPQDRMIRESLEVLGGKKIQKEW